MGVPLCLCVLRRARSVHLTYISRLALEIRDEVPTDKIPSTNTEELFLLYAVLLLAKGEAVTREDVHNAWVAWMTSRGEQHESMVPFTELPANIQAEDSPFAYAIKRVAQRQRERTSG